MKTTGANLYIKNGTLIDGVHGHITGNLLIIDGKIAEVGEACTVALEQLASQGKADTIHTIDATGKLVAPGFIDAHTHYHLVSRGVVTADSFFEGSQLAAFGGVTTVIDFANHLPATKGTTNPSLEDSAKARIAEAKDMAIDYNLHQCVVRLPENPTQELTRLRELGIASIKVFTTYKKVGLYIESDALEQLFEACADTGLFVTAHCEDDPTIEHLEEKYAARQAQDPTFQITAKDHADMRPPKAEAIAIQWIAELCHRTRAHLFVVHLSSYQGLQKIRELRQRGYDITTETTPHYLFKDRSLLEGSEGILYVMTPPLREASEATGLWQGLVAGDISMVATDHCAFTKEQKFSSRDPRKTFPGIPGTEEMYYMLYTKGVASGTFSFDRLVQLLSVNSAKLFGLYPKKGSLKVGSDGDVVIIDPTQEWTITHQNQHSAAGYSAFHGEKVKSCITHTVLRGKVIMQNGEFLGNPGDGHFVPARFVG